MRPPSHILKPSPLLALLAFAATVLLASRASAAVVVVVGGDADQATRRTLADAVTEGLREHRADLGDLSLRPTDVDALILCVADEASQACAAKFMETAQASRAIVMRVVRDRGGSTTIYGWVVATAGSVLAVNQRVCERCSSAKLAESARSLLEGLLKDVEARTMPATLAVRTIPPGAEVELDGRLIGVTPLEHGVYAGTRRIVLHLRGYEESIQEREVLPGETTVVEVELRPAKPTKGPRLDGGPTPGAEVTRPFRWKPWAVIGTGAVLAIAGGALVALDQDDDGPDPFQYRHRETMTLGLGGIGLGTAVAAVGVVWLLRDDEPKRRAPTVAVDRGHVVFGYGGSF